LMQSMRSAIEAGTFEAFKREFAAKRQSLWYKLQSVLKSEANFLQNPVYLKRVQRVYFKCIRSRRCPK
jgi:hypothetical protein